MLELKVIEKHVELAEVLAHQPDHLLDYVKGRTFWVANSWPPGDSPVNWGMVRSGDKVRIPMHLLVVSSQAPTVMAAGVEQGARAVYDLHDHKTAVHIDCMHLVISDQAMRLPDDDETVIRVLLGVAFETRMT